jgi:hypothetical protein
VKENGMIRSKKWKKPQILDKTLDSPCWVFELVGFVGFPFLSLKFPEYREQYYLQLSV